MVKIIVWTIFVSIITSFSFAKTHNCDETKKLPMLIESCEGEACGFYHYDKTLEDISLYKKPSLKSKKL